MTEGGCGDLHVVVSAKQIYPGQARDIFGLVWGLPTLSIKHCVVVDGDVDPWNVQQVEWAVATRVQASRDVEILNRGRTNPLDPSKPPSFGFISDKMAIDATKPAFDYGREQAEFPPSADPPPEHTALVRERWAAYGFRR